MSLSAAYRGAARSSARPAI